MNERTEIWLRFIGYKLAELLGVGVLSVGAYYIGKLFNSWMPKGSQVTGVFILWLTGLFGLILIIVFIGLTALWVDKNWEWATEDTKTNRKKKGELMNELIWRTESEMQAELVVIGNTRDISVYGRDGHMLAATGEFEYKGMKYVVNVLRYYVLDEGFKPMYPRASGEYFVNVEYPDSMIDIVATVHMIRAYSNEFLYKDSNHMYLDDKTLDEQIAEMHKQAQEDIDSLPDLPIEVDKQIAALEEVKRKISTMKIYG